MPDAIRIAVIDDHPLFRQGVVQALTKMDGIEVVGFHRYANWVRFQPQRRMGRSARTDDQNLTFRPTRPRFSVR